MNKNSSRIRMFSTEDVFTQDNDCCDDGNLGQSITASTEDGGGSREMSDTPETDALAKMSWDREITFTDMAVHARKLERERDELNKLFDEEVKSNVEARILLYDTRRERDKMMREGTALVAALEKQKIKTYRAERERDELTTKLSDVSRKLAVAERERDEARAALAKWESSSDAMERAGAEQARRANENREWALKAERERDEARALVAEMKQAIICAKAEAKERLQRLDQAACERRTWLEAHGQMKRERDEARSKCDKMMREGTALVALLEKQKTKTYRAERERDEAREALRFCLSALKSHHMSRHGIPTLVKETEAKLMRTHIFTNQ